MDLSENITVIGIGKIGLCFSLCMEKVGYDVLGVDITAGYIDSINKKTLLSHEPGLTSALMKSNNFKATLSLKDGIGHSDKIFIFLATNVGHDDYDNKN